MSLIAGRLGLHRPHHPSPGLDERETAGAALPGGAGRTSVASARARPRLWIWLWLAFVVLGVVCRPIMPIDETRYVSVAWEMYSSGDLLVPHMNGAPYSHKPPLLFWLIVAGWHLFGVSELWARLVSPLFGLAALATTRALGNRLWGCRGPALVAGDAGSLLRTPPPGGGRPGTGDLAATLQISALLFAITTTTLMFDMMLVTGVELAYLASLILGQGERLRGTVILGAGLALALFAKGAVGLLFTLPVLLAAPWWMARPARGWPSWYRGLVVAVVAGVAAILAWALPAAYAGGTEYRSELLFGQIANRVVATTIHARPVWWYLALLPAVLLPLSLWPPAWRGAASLRHVGGEVGVRLGLAWLVLGLVPLSLIGSKQAHYLVPLLPAVALLLARGLERCSTARAPRLDSLLPAVPLAAMGALVLALRNRDLVREAAQPWLAGAAGTVLLLAGVALGATALLRRRLPLLFAPVVSILALFAVVHAVVWVLRPAYDVTPTAVRVRALEDDGSPVGYVGAYHDELQFPGRLSRPLALVAHGGERAWLVQQPHGARLVAVVRDGPPSGLRSEFSQPYRADSLAVLALDAPATTGSAVPASAADLPPSPVGAAEPTVATGVTSAASRHRKG